MKNQTPKLQEYMVISRTLKTHSYTLHTRSKTLLVPNNMISEKKSRIFNLGLFLVASSILLV